MAKITVFLFAIFLILPSWASEPIRVAAVGNSITYGAGVEHRETNSYPAQLQRVLGAGYEVKNFGVSATTLMDAGDYPYTTTPQYQASLAYRPQIVLIKLGTNDAKKGNRLKLAEHYKKDYQTLINTYQALGARVILMNPVACVAVEGLHADSDPVFKQQVLPILEELAYENNIELIDLYHVFDNKSVPAYVMPDKLHPSAIGATRMVERIAPVVKAQPQVTSPALKVVPIKKARTFNFHGYQGYQWDEGAVKGYKIVVPKVNSKNGNQWVIRARFWGHEPQTDQALLERGFHIVYCPVENLYGAPQAVERWSAFYKKMVRAGFADKVVLEGMSRGGLIVYNWAAQNPEKVAAIYADAPVMDIKSWPMAAKGFDGDVAGMLKVYGFADTTAANAFKGNPIDHAAAVKKIPMLHVVGQADDVVPVQKNTDVFKERVQQEGGRVMTIRKQGVGHHPHSLQVPTTIVNFILRHTEQLDNVCVAPIPGQEWRPAAGWAQGCDWWAVADELTQMAGKESCDVLLLGNSITQGFGGTRTRITGFQGKPYMDAALGDSVRWIPAGISGDRTEHLLWRLRECGYWNWQPKQIFITIGVNNLTAGDDPLQVAWGVEAIAREAAAMWPKAKITVFGTLPYYDLGKSQTVRGALDKVLWPSNVQFADVWDWFVAPNGAQRTEYYGGDKLHLSGKGYEMWSEKIAQIVQQSAK